MYVYLNIRKKSQRSYPPLHCSDFGPRAEFILRTAERFFDTVSARRPRASDDPSYIYVSPPGRMSTYYIVSSSNRFIIVISDCAMAEKKKPRGKKALADSMKVADPPTKVEKAIIHWVRRNVATKKTKVTRCISLNVASPFNFIYTSYFSFCTRTWWSTSPARRRWTRS